MALPLPLVEQVEAAGRMAQRCHIHLALWRLTAGVEGRRRHWDVLDEHWEHIRFLEHGQLVTAVLELHSMLDADKSTINLPHLVVAVEVEHGNQPIVKEALKETASIFKKVRVLRNAVYAHRTKKKSYNDVFKVASITPDQLQDLVLLCVKISNELRVLVGNKAEAPASLPVEMYEKMLLKLAEQI